MYVHLTGFLFSLFIVLHIWIILTIFRQKLPSIISPIFIYLNLQFIIIQLCLLFYLAPFSEQFLRTIFKIQFIAEIFIPPVLVYLHQTYSSGIKIPTLNLRSSFFFLISLALSVLALLDLMGLGGTNYQGMYFPVYSKFYIIVIGYFYFTFGYLIFHLFQKIQIEKRQIEAANVKFLLTTLLPVIVVSFTFLKLLPFWGFYHPVLYLSYLVFSISILHFATKFQLLEIDATVHRSFSFFLISTIFFILISFLFPVIHVQIYFLNIPFLLGLLMIYQIFDTIVQPRLMKQNYQKEYDLEEELEVLVNETEKYIDQQALAQFIGDLSLKVLQCTKVAIIRSQFDVKPYQITYLSGFEKDKIENLLSISNSPFIETLEYNRAIINRFELSPKSALYQLLDEYHIYLVIPMVAQGGLQGFIMLGGERKSFQISKKDLKFARFLSMRASHAFQNIQEIQKMVQSQKMAELGLLASQLAHDFQSFITLVKLETRNNPQLKQHANYTEKLVKDLLHYARPKELHLSLVNVNHLIDMTLDLIKIPPHIRLERNYSDSIPQINVDVDQMQRVFLNLCENSIGAIKENKGRIKITTRPLRPLSDFRRTTWIYIEFLDDGEGIPEEFLDKIFDPFFTTRKREGGNGMGLAIVRQIITAHHGFIDVTSKLGKGTIFNIRLPYLI